MEAKRKSERNSNIEVLRLVAMGLIVLNHLQWGEMHYIDTNWSYIHRMGISQIVTFLSNWGGVGWAIAYSSGSVHGSCVQNDRVLGRI